MPPTSPAAQETKFSVCVSVLCVCQHAHFQPLAFSFREHWLCTKVIVNQESNKPVSKWPFWFHCWVKNVRLSGPLFVLGIIDICFTPRLSDS